MSKRRLSERVEDRKKVGEILSEQGLTKNEVRLKMEMIARAYDPCISCATHEIKFVEK